MNTEEEELNKFRQDLYFKLQEVVQMEFHNSVAELVDNGDEYPGDFVIDALGGALASIVHHIVQSMGDEEDTYEEIQDEVLGLVMNRFNEVTAALTGKESKVDIAALDAEDLEPTNKTLH